MGAVVVLAVVMEGNGWKSIGELRYISDTVGCDNYLCVVLYLIKKSETRFLLQYSLLIFFNVAGASVMEANFHTIQACRNIQLPALPVFSFTQL